MNMLGQCYNTAGNGKGCDQNLTKAVELYEKSAQLGNSDAMYNLGECYETGDGVTKDFNKARKWYTKAAAQGDEDAQTILETLALEVNAAELENEDASLSRLDETERETTQANDGGVVGETKSNGGVVGETQLEPASNDQLRATNKTKNPVVGVTTVEPQLNDKDFHDLLGACHKGKLTKVKKMLKKKNANVNQVGREDEITALIAACAGGQMKVVKHLLKMMGIQVNKANKHSATALYFACQVGRVAVVKVLIARKDIQINQAEKSGATPLYKRIFLRPVG